MSGPSTSGMLGLAMFGRLHYSLELGAASLPSLAMWQRHFDVRRAISGDDTLDQTADQLRTLDKFLASVERRAFQIARMALRDEDEALDIVQDAMLKLARSYATRPSEEWPPLFYRILNNRIRDWQRRRTVRNKLFGWLPGFQSEESEDGDPYQAVPDQARGPSEQVMLGDAMAVLAQALTELPARQREAFTLRNFEGLDVAGTALAMGCTEGSVKTHYSRAVHALRVRLGDHW